MTLQEAQFAVVGKTIVHNNRTGRVIDVAPNRSAGQFVFVASQDTSSHASLADADVFNVTIRWADGEIETIKGAAITEAPTVAED